MGTNASGRKESKKEAGEGPPVILDGLVKPGFFNKTFTCLFFKNIMVFIKTGNMGTNTGGRMQAVLGGPAGAGMIAGAIGSLFDSLNSRKRVDHAVDLSLLDPEDIINSGKLNFGLTYDSVSQVFIKPPGWSGELKIRIVSNGEVHKFVMEKQSKASAKYVVGIFGKYLPGKVH